MNCRVIAILDIYLHYSQLRRAEVYLDDISPWSKINGIFLI